MDDREHERLAQMEQSYWWHVGRRTLTSRILRQNLPAGRELEVVDVGCGAGGNLELLDQFGRARGVEPPGPGLDGCRARGLGPERVLAGEADALPLEDESVDLVTLFDVLEHLDDDQAAVLEAYRVLKPGGWLCVTVPAYRFLWSIHDESLGHRRRYMASEIHTLLNTARFRVLRRTYAITFALPAIMGLRIAQGLIPSLYRRGSSYVELPGPLNKLLVRVLQLESALIDRVDLPIGTSILALGQKS